MRLNQSSSLEFSNKLRCRIRWSLQDCSMLAACGDRAILVQINHVYEEIVWVDDL